MTTRTTETATFRKVVLLRPSENKRLQKLARANKVSTSEIIRRSIDAYATNSPVEDQEEMRTVIAQMNEALDNALSSVRSARVEIAKNLNEIRLRKERVA